MIKKIKLFLTDYKYLNFKNLYNNFFIPGERINNSLIIQFGRFYINVHKNSKINIKRGYLFFNKPARVKEPFIGMLEMQENSSINVNNTSVFQAGAHIILMKNAILNLGGVYVNRYVRIRCFSKIEIGNNTVISENVAIWDSDAHQTIKKDHLSPKPVVIGNDVWIGTNVTILKGVRIGDGAIIAAGSLVNKDIPEKCLAAGIPAKVVSENVGWK